MGIHLTETFLALAEKVIARGGPLGTIEIPPWITHHHLVIHFRLQVDNVVNSMVNDAEAL